MAVPLCLSHVDRNTFLAPWKIFTQHLRCLNGCAVVFVPRRPQHLPSALEDLEEPVDVDEVENDARRQQDPPDATELHAGRGAVDGVHLVPVRRNACDADDEEHDGHGDAVQQDDGRRLRIAEHVEEPPTGRRERYSSDGRQNQIITDNMSYCILRRERQN